MNSKSLIWGLVGTAVWLLIILLFAVLNGYELPNSLNELGDALAGIVAPIAFFWLILGYLQQGKQLDQNTKALEQQEKALNSQITEMKIGIEEQKKLTEAYKSEEIAKHFSVQPYFEYSVGNRKLEIEGVTVDEYINSNGRIFEDFRNVGMIKLILKNLGMVAKNISIVDITDEANSQNLFSAYEIEKNEVVNLKYVIDPDEFKQLEDNFNYEIKLRVRYSDMYGLEYLQFIEIECKASLFPKDHTYTVTIFAKHFEKLSKNA